MGLWLSECKDSGTRTDDCYPVRTQMPAMLTRSLDVMKEFEDGSNRVFEVDEMRCGALARGSV